MDFYTFLEKYKKYLFNTNEPVFEFEVDLFEHFQRNTFSSVIKSRQMGLSNLFLLYIAWFAIHNYRDDITIVYLAKQPTRNEFHAIYGLLENYYHDLGGERHYYAAPRIRGGRNSCIEFNNTSIEFKSTLGREYYNDKTILIIDEINLGLDDYEFFQANKRFRQIIFGSSINSHIKITNMRYDTVQLTINDSFNIITNNFYLHYSKSPRWTYDNLETLFSKYDYPEQWVSEMDCNIELFSDFIGLTPFKTERMKKIELFIKEKYENI